MSDYRRRAVVLILLVIFAFIPCLLYVEFARFLFLIVIFIAVGEQLIVCSKITSRLTRYTIGLPMILGWALPSLTRLSSILKDENSHKETLYIVFLVLIVSDSAQLITGRKFGKTKIFAKISKNKTLEGYLFGFCISYMIALILPGFFPKERIPYVLIAGMTGDLFFSFLKRLARVKDYSRLLGSHGGVSDRIDSLIFALHINHQLSIVQS